MKRAALIISVILMGTSFCAMAVCAADNFPSQKPWANPAEKAPNAAVKPNTSYGYVPPAPIRHTWPGGYRVIFHELSNTLMEHILGQY
jgi:hypothetical protein